VSAGIAVEQRLDFCLGRAPSFGGDRGLALSRVDIEPNMGDIGAWGETRLPYLILTCAFSVSTTTASVILSALAIEETTNSNSLR
jgi:hypothetical protein